MPPFQAYLGPEGISLAGKALPAVKSQVSMSRPAPPSRAENQLQLFPACIHILTLGKWAAVTEKNK